MTKSRNNVTFTLFTLFALFSFFSFSSFLLTFLSHCGACSDVDQKTLLPFVLAESLPISALLSQPWQLGLIPHCLLNN